MQLVENYYFLIFVVVLAVACLWIFMRGGRRQTSQKKVRTPSGRTLGGERLRQDVDRRGPSARSGPAHKSSAAGRRHHQDPWKSRTVETAAGRKARSSANTASSVNRSRHGIMPAYGTPRPQPDAISDQQISKAEHLGIDEYFHKMEKERELEAAARAAEEETSLTMTAVKYETGDEADSGEGETPRKQLGFKP